MDEKNHGQEFDPNLPPQNKVNVEAARRRGWKFCTETRVYYDDSGYPIADSRGIPHETD